MCEDRKKTPAGRGHAIQQGFADRPTRALDELLSSDVLGAIVDEEVGAFRERVYPPLTTLGLFIGQALSADGGCQDAVARHLSERTARATLPAVSAVAPPARPGSGCRCR